MHRRPTTRILGILAPLAAFAAFTSFGQTGGTREIAEFAEFAATGVRISSDATTHLTLDRDAEPFRSAFNANAGMVRIVMLVAPT